MADLDALAAALAAAASPLTWHRDRGTVYARMTVDPATSEEHAVCDAFTDDAALIVAAVNALPSLLAIARAAKAWVAARRAYDVATTDERYFNTADEMYAAVYAAEARLRAAVEGVADGG